MFSDFYFENFLYFGPYIGSLVGQKCEKVWVLFLPSSSNPKLLNSPKLPALVLQTWSASIFWSKMCIFLKVISCMLHQSFLRPVNGKKSQCECTYCYKLHKILGFWSIEAAVLNNRSIIYKLIFLFQTCIEKGSNVEKASEPTLIFASGLQ